VVGQGLGPDGAAGVVADAAGVVGGGVVAGAVLSVVAGAALLLAVVVGELPHAVARTATLVSAAAASARRATRWVESITVSFWLSRLREPCDSYDADTGFPVAGSTPRLRVRRRWTMGL
jgi:hypothetical protein